MKETLQVLNDLKEEGILQEYALGGATALLFYAEPMLTFDVDVFVYLPGKQDLKTLVDLSSLYAALKTKGYTVEKEHVLIKGIPVQFIPVYNALVEEAVKEASKKEYEGVKIRVFKLEYLLAIMVDTHRPKDKERIRKIVEETAFDQKTLEDILKRHGLQNRWEKIVENK